MFREAQRKIMSVFSAKPKNNGRGGDGCDGTGMKCGRWSPTSEQVKVLTDLFRSGLRTPTTDQIQKISSQLSSYGKVESKNVFYWFQNHKARERHKRRRVSVLDNDDHEIVHNVHRTDKIVVSIKNFGDMGKVLETEKVIETLELFPLNTFNDSKAEKLMTFVDQEYKDNTKITYSFHTNMDYPPLDLRLSFL